MLRTVPQLKYQLAIGEILCSHTDKPDTYLFLDNGHTVYLYDDTCYYPLPVIFFSPVWSIEQNLSPDALAAYQQIGK